MNNSIVAADLAELVSALTKPTALLEAGVVLGCLAAAWLIARLWRGKAPRKGSIWFGERIIDGLLFPVLALVLALGARWVLQDRLPLAVFHLVTPVLVSLVVIRLLARVMKQAFPHSSFVHLVQTTVSWMAWIGVALWITGILPLLLNELDAISWKIGATRISVRNLIEGAVTAIVVLMLALWLSATLEARLLKGATHDLSVRKMAANVLRAVLLFVGLMFALSAAGIDLTALGVIGGALGVGVGFGLQKLAANYISGFVMLAERSMRIGDMVKVDGFEGVIRDITTRYTVIRALNGRDAIVPNELMVTQRVENASLGDRRVQFSTVVQVAYGTALDALIPQLEAAVAQVPRVLAEPAPGVLLREFAANGLELLIAFWIDDPHNGHGNVRSEVNLAVLRTLNAAGVEIPYPQQVVHEAPPPAAAADATASAPKPRL
jgi:small-conductance mechanosensitive channel